MKESSVCKFVPQPNFTDFSTVRFILETDPLVMEQDAPLREERVILVTDGSGTFSFDDKLYACQKGDVLFGFLDETMRAVGEKLQYAYIDFKGARSSALFKRFSVGQLRRLFRGHEGLIPLWKEGLARADEHNIDLVAESILLYTFSVLKANKTGVGEVTSEMLALTEKHFTDSELSLSSLAEQMGYNAKYLSTLFKKQTGFSYSEYLRSLRIKYAVTLFDHGIESVRNVAFLSGFSDPLYFSTVFKKDVGVSPKEYVKK